MVRVEYFLPKTENKAKTSAFKIPIHVVLWFLASATGKKKKKKIIYTQTGKEVKMSLSVDIITMYKKMTRTNKCV